MTIVCKSTLTCVCKRVCLIGVTYFPPSLPRQILNLDPLRLLQMQSGTNFPNNILMTLMSSNK